MRHCFCLAALLCLGAGIVAAPSPTAAAQLSPLTAQPSSTNRVLELDGNGSYVELPPNIFKDLTEATVEGWVKWNSFRIWSRFFDFGARWNGMAVTHQAATPELQFHLFVPDRARHLI